MAFIKNHPVELLVSKPRTTTEKRCILPIGHGLKCLFVSNVNMPLHQCNKKGRAQ